MARLSAIKKGIKDAISQQLPGVNAYAVMVPNPVLPAVIPKLVSWRRHETFDDKRRYTFIVWAYTNAADLNNAQTALDDLLSDEGPKSVAVALETFPSLNSTVDDLMVIGGDDYGPVVWDNGQQMLAGGITVEFLA